MDELPPKYEGKLSGTENWTNVGRVNGFKSYFYVLVDPNSRVIGLDENMGRIGCRMLKVSYVQECLEAGRLLDMDGFGLGWVPWREEEKREMLEYVRRMRVKIGQGVDRDCQSLGFWEVARRRNVLKKKRSAMRMLEHFVLAVRKEYFEHYSWWHELPTKVVVRELQVLKYRNVDNREHTDNVSCIVPERSEKISANVIGDYEEDDSASEKASIAGVYESTVGDAEGGQSPSAIADLGGRLNCSSAPAITSFDERQDNNIPVHVSTDMQECQNKTFDRAASVLARNYNISSDDAKCALWTMLGDFDKACDLVEHRIRDLKNSTVFIIEDDSSTG